MLWRLIGAALLAVLALAVPPAQAAFPGANGRIAFVSDRDGNKEIYSMNADGSGVTRLTTNAAKDDDPAWSPDGAKIAFVSDRDGNDEIYVMNANGSGQTRLATLASNDSQPAWSPDGKRVAFWNDAVGTPCFGEFGERCLYVVNASGTGMLQLAAEITGFGWSPDAQRLVFGRNNDGLYAIKADGTDLQLILPIDHDAPNTPIWSPNGSRILFTVRSPNGMDFQLFGVDADGSDATFIAGTEAECDLHYPKWSPTGAIVAFLKDFECASIQIHVMGADGSGITPLTSSLDNRNHDWSPDGSRIVFQSLVSPGADYEIHTIGANGSAEANLTNNPAEDTQPDWQPLNAFTPYPRPGGATPLLVWLVPAFEQCTAPNSNHVSPLSAGSCEPPVQVSDLLTTSKIGRGKGSVRLDTVVGNPGTQADEADVNLTVEISDVRKASDQSDYAGSVVLTSSIRTTDRDNGFVGISETVSDTRFDIPIACTPSVPSPRGADCNLTTTLDSLVPGMIREGKRTILASHSFSLLDAGLDGSVAGPNCPPTCGTGDEERFLEQGTFTP